MLHDSSEQLQQADRAFLGKSSRITIIKRPKSFAKAQFGVIPSSANSVSKMSLSPPLKRSLSHPEILQASHQTLKKHRRNSLRQDHINKLPPQTPVLKTNMNTSEALSLAPTEDEITGYYFGLRSSPRLVARTSLPAWEPHSEMLWRVQKELSNVGIHPIVDLYDEAMRGQIVEALDGLHWSCVDVLRIGHENQKERPLILWIGVEKGSTTWKEGYSCLEKCQGILNAYGVGDIRCEMRETEMWSQGGRALRRLQTTDECNLSDLAFTQTIGQSIAPLDNPTTEGSLGLYMKINGTDTCTALTNRHVVFHPKSDSGDAYLYRNVSQPRYAIVQPGETSFEAQMSTNTEAIKFWSDAARHKQPLEVADTMLKPLEKKKDTLNEFEKPVDRIIGHIYASPAPGTHPSLGFLRDWALLDLDLAKFGDSDPENHVYIGSLDMRALNEWKIKNYNCFAIEAMGNSMKVLKLRDTVSVAEIKRPSMLDPKGDPVLYVGKFGRTTGLTWGKGNELKSMTRKYLGEKPSLEWLIMGLFKQVFSSPGDSGSAVFDINGRIAAILSAGHGITESTDITYATPIEWVLKDIRMYIKKDVHLL